MYNKDKLFTGVRSPKFLHLQPISTFIYIAAQCNSWHQYRNMQQYDAFFMVCYRHDS